MKEDFVPYLPVVMGPILKATIQEIQFTMVDVVEGEEEEEENEDEDEGQTGGEERRTHTAVISLGGGVRKRVTLNTFAVQQKAQATRLIFELGSVLKGRLSSFLLPTLEALLPCLTDKHSADIRSTASLALAQVFAACIDAEQGDQKLPQALNLPTILTFTVTKLLESLKGENNASSRVSSAEALRDVLQACHQSGTLQADGSRLSPLCTLEISFAGNVVRELMERCSESMKRRAALDKSGHHRQSSEAYEEAEEDEENEQLEEEEECLSVLVDALGQVVKLQGEGIMPQMDSLVAPSFASLLDLSQPEALQLVGISLLDDLIEFGALSACKYVPQAMPRFLQIMANKSPSLLMKQAASYGIAQSARRDPSSFAPFMTATLPLLYTVLQGLNKEEEDNQGTIENIIFAFSVIYCCPLYRGIDWGEVTPAMMASIWMGHLPLQADEVEAKITHHLFVDCVEKLDVNILGENHSNMSRVLTIFGELLFSIRNEEEEEDYDDYALILPATAVRMKEVIVQIATSSSKDHFLQLLGTMQVEHRSLMVALFPGY